MLISRPIFMATLVFFLLLVLASTACAQGPELPVLKIGGIPDQDSSRLARRYQEFSDYLSQQLGVPVE